MTQTTIHLPSQNVATVNLDKVEFSIPQPKVEVNVSAPSVHVEPLPVVVNVPEANVQVTLPEMVVNVHPEILSPDVFLTVDINKLVPPLYILSGSSIILVVLKIIDMFLN